MAKIPTPRSYSAVLTDMVDAFLAKFGLKQLKVGSPVLSILEAAAMSDVRSSQDVFDLLASTNLDRATGTALDRIAADENMTRLAQSPSSGTVNISDSRMTKTTTRIYQGGAAPIAGSASILVTDANSFPKASDPASKRKIYIGRGTANSEGPLAYKDAVDKGTHWEIQLEDGYHTSKFHNLGETVVLAQNGNRTINAGTVVQTAQGGSANSVQFTTLYSASIPDGEESVEGVIVVARQAGEASNVPQNTVNSFASAPFPGAEVINPLPFSNGREAENDTDLRERIKNTRQSRSRGTALAVKSSVLGILSAEENKRIVSASLVKRHGDVASLYIDDGTGYEERSAGTALESLNDLAFGGEQYFQLSSQPVAKAFVKTTNTAPFALSNGARLSVLVGGVLSEHTFDSSSFRSISNATAYEVVASVNANAEALFGARTADGGSAVVLFAKSDTNEDIQVTSPVSGTDANDNLLFPTSRVDTIRLYKNDRLLSKDGKIAQVYSAPVSTWKTLSGAQTLTVAVDGTPAAPYSFTAQDFIDAGTGFSQMGINTAQAWAAVFNAKIPGITASVISGCVVLTSNAGRSSKAKIEISGGSLVTNGVFSNAMSVGAAKDYTLDRNLGQIRLETALSAGDRLTVGSKSTRAFIESAEIKSLSLQDDGILYFAVDGNAEVVNIGVNGTTTFTLSAENESGTKITANSTAFTNVKEGDWLLLWDGATGFSDLKGQWRVSSRSDTYLVISSPDGPTAGSVALANGGMAVIRFEGVLKKVVVPKNTTYTAASLCAKINEQLSGATCSVYRTKKLRIRTNTFADNGAIALVAANDYGKSIGLPLDIVKSRDSHLASAESGASVFGTPDFKDYCVQVIDSNGIGLNSIPSLNYSAVGLKKTTSSYIGNNWNFVSAVKEISSGSLTLRNDAKSPWFAHDRLYAAAPFALGPQDDLVLVADDDVQTKRYSVPMWYAAKPADTTYGTENSFKDPASSTNSSLARVFGTDYDFNDHAIYMKARVAVAHSTGGTPDVLYRYKRFGPEGERAAVRYVYPDTANQALSVSVNGTTDDKTKIDIALPSGASKLSGIATGSVLGYSFVAGSQSSLPKVTVVLALQASITATTSAVTVTVTLPGDASEHGLAEGDTIYFASTHPRVLTGAKTVAAPLSATTFTITEAGAAVADPIAAGKLYKSLPATTQLNLSANDLVHFDIDSSVPDNLKGMTFRVNEADPGNLWFTAFLDKSVVTNFPLSWDLPIANGSKIQAFPLKTDKCTAQEIVTAVNGLGDSCPVTASLLKVSGAVSASTSTAELEKSIDKFYNLLDGVNWVKTTNKPIYPTDNYSFVFKKTPAPSLASGCKWEDEDVRIVPITLAGIKNWLSVPALSGVFGTCSIETSSLGTKLQLSSLTPGADGAIQVQGGSANSVTASVVGAAQTAGSCAVCDVRSSDAEPLQADQWVIVQNAIAMPKAGLLTSKTVTSVEADGTFHFSSAFNSSTTETRNVTFEKQGNFVAITRLAGNKTEGSWIIVGGDTASSANKGTFRVVRSTASTVWIENPNAVEETAACILTYRDANSLMVGDVVSINTPVFGTDKIGRFVVTNVANDSFKLDFKKNVIAVTESQTLADNDITVTEASPARYIKKIHAIYPSPSGTGLVSVKFDTSAGYGNINSSAGSVITVLDKLNFADTTSYGVDGYSYSTGLISEANKVVYGDGRDTSTYPGVAAIGSVINISGPIIKRAVVSVSIRARFGVSTSEISDKVKASIATTINRSAIGQAIAISDIVRAASRVTGVQAVTILEPDYTSGSDMIAVQPYEKLLVLDVDQDITVTFVGE